MNRFLFMRSIFIVSFIFVFFFHDAFARDVAGRNNGVQYDSALEIKKCYNLKYDKSPYQITDFLNKTGRTTSLFLHKVFVPDGPYSSGTFKQETKGRANPTTEILTLFCGLTLSRLEALEAQCRSWHGPLSAAVYLPFDSRHFISTGGQQKDLGTKFTPERLPSDDSNSFTSRLSDNQNEQLRDAERRIQHLTSRIKQSRRRLVSRVVEKEGSDATHFGRNTSQPTYLIKSSRRLLSRQDPETQAHNAIMEALPMHPPCRLTVLFLLEAVDPTLDVKRLTRFVHVPHNGSRPALSTESDLLPLTPPSILGQESHPQQSGVLQKKQEIAAPLLTLMPINELREAAALAAQTPLTAMIDVDLLPYTPFSPYFSSVDLHNPAVVDSIRGFLREGDSGFQNTDLRRVLRNAVAGPKQDLDKRVEASALAAAVPQIAQIVSRESSSSEGSADSVSKDSSMEAEGPMVGNEGLRMVLNICTDPKRRNLVVLPAFEPVESLGVADGETLANLLVVTGSKPLLRRLYAARLLDPFALHVYARGHAPTDFRRWFLGPGAAAADREALRPNDLDLDELKKDLGMDAASAAWEQQLPEGFYRINYRANYEPWFVVARQTMPRYDTRFRGYGWNKVQQVALANASGFNFLVHPSWFVVHKPHAPSDANAAYHGASGALEAEGRSLSTGEGAVVHDLSFNGDEASGGGDDDLSPSSATSSSIATTPGRSLAGTPRRTAAASVLPRRGAKFTRMLFTKLIRRRVAALRHVSLRDMLRGTYTPVTSPQVAHCRETLPWWRSEDTVS